MQRIYLDSNVFISLINKEIDRQARGLFVEAEHFLELLKKKGDVLILSAIFFEEVKEHSHFSQGEVIAYFKEQGIHTQSVGLKPGLPWRMFAVQGLHYSDALHLAAAIAFNCHYFVTFNVKHFEKLECTIKVVEPAEFD